MPTSNHVFACSIVAFTLLAPALALAVPGTMSFQGLLTDGAGDPVIDSTYQVDFAIYTVSTGGSAIWSESHLSVMAVDGLFNVILGNTNPLDTMIFSGADLWLGVTVGADPEISPRTPLTSAGYAQRAAVADNVVAGNDWFVAGDLSDLVSGNGALIAYPAEEYAYGFKFQGSIVHEAICSHWNSGLRFYNLRPFFVDSDNMSATGAKYGGLFWIIGTNDPADDAATPTNWYAAYWHIDYTNATYPIQVFSVLGLAQAQVYARNR